MADMMIVTEYFDWLMAKVYDTSSKESYHNLMWYLFNRQFCWPDEIPMDENRAIDGIKLREEFGDSYGGSRSVDEIDDYLQPNTCMWLEMMVALSMRCEQEIMAEYNMGDRTGEWFWIAMNNLGLGLMSNGNFDENYIEMCLDRFENREYNSDGSEGGMYVLQNPRPDRDMRTADIWYQLNWYLTERLTEEGII